MGHDTRDIYIEKILRCFPDPFTVEDFVYYLSCVGCEISTEEANNYIESSSCVIKLEGSYFITHAGLFSNKFFTTSFTFSSPNPKVLILVDPHFSQKW